MKSDKWDDYDGKEFVNDVSFLLQRFWNWNRNAKHHIVAHSYGAALSLLALMHLKTNTIDVGVENVEKGFVVDSLTLACPAVHAPLANSWSLYLTPVAVMNLFRQSISDNFNRKCYHSKTPQSLIDQQVAENKSNSL
jgi:pimeloyl-ACP methyl ester carboxylesterase